MTTVRIAILDDYQSVALSSADWTPLKEKAHIDVFRDTISDEDTLVNRLVEYQVICTMRERTRFAASLLDRLPNLRLLTTTGMRNAAIDVEHAKKKGITVSGTGGGGNSTLEHIWALLLATVRHLAAEDINIKNCQAWQTKIPFGLSGRTLGIVGAGRLGTQTAQIAKAFSMKVVGWSPNLTPERAAAAGVELVSKETLFRTSDVVSIHLVLSESTRHLVSANELGLMKSTAFLINTSRGPIVDEQALLDVLKKERIAAAGLDVFDIEPLPQDHPFRQLKNVTLSPHNGYVNDSNYEVFWRETVENIISFLEGDPKRVL